MKLSDGSGARTTARQRMLFSWDKLEAAIRAQPADRRDAFRIVQLKEKFGRLTVYQDQLGTTEMRAAIEEAGEASIVTCEICGEPGRLAERNVFWSVKCASGVPRIPWRPSHRGFWADSNCSGLTPPR